MARPVATHCRDCGDFLEENNCAYIRSKRPGYPDKIRSNRCRNCLNTYMREHRRNNKEQTALTNRRSNLKVLYGLSREEYEYMVQVQGGVCAICRESDEHELSVDHNHRTNEVRGLLCKSCNLAIGHLKEDPNLIMNLYDYLERTTWNKNSVKVFFHDGQRTNTERKEGS